MFIFLSIRSICDCDSDSDSEGLYCIVFVSSLEEELHKIQLSPSQDERQLGVDQIFYVLPGLPLSSSGMGLRAGLSNKRLAH